MKTASHSKRGRLLLLGVFGLVQTCRADSLVPGDPRELVPLGIIGIVWLVLLAASLIGLHLIRRSHGLLPPP